MARSDRSFRAEQWTDLVRSLSACTRQLRRILAECCQCAGLTDTQFLLLFACLRPTTDATAEGQPAQNDLAALVGISPAQLSGLVEQLRQRQLVEVQRCQEDRRRQVLQPTERGRELVDQVLHHLEVLAEQLGPLLDSAEAQLLPGFMHKLEVQSRQCQNETDRSVTIPWTQKRAA